MGFLFYHLQILLYPLRRGHVVLLLEGGVEDGLALESGALRDAFDRGGQVRTISKWGVRKGALNTKSRIQIRAFLCLTWRTSRDVLTNGV